MLGDEAELREVIDHRVDRSGVERGVGQSDAAMQDTIIGRVIGSPTRVHGAGAGVGAGDVDDFGKRFGKQAIVVGEIDRELAATAAKTAPQIGEQPQIVRQRDRLKPVMPGREGADQRGQPAGRSVVDDDHFELERKKAGRIELLEIVQQEPGAIVCRNADREGRPHNNLAAQRCLKP
ncbi:MAG: hypothetical protein WDO24_11980 [Pseudomonadota bacterium]